MGGVNRKRHEFLGFIAGKAEHHALVAGPLFGVQALAGGDALGDVGRLTVERGQDGAGIAVKSQRRIIEADIAYRPAHDVGVVNASLGGDLSRHHHHACFHQGFAGDSAVRVLGQQSVQDPVRNLIAHFVWMALGYRFRGKQKIFSRHQPSPCLALGSRIARRI